MKLARRILSSTSSRRAARRGLALILVLLVLLALLVLCAPFLMSARNASRASAALADREQARLSLDAGSRRAQANLTVSHPSVDTTPYFDSIDELHVDGKYDKSFWNTRDSHGAMWDVEAHDIASLIDWNSASPQLFANALGAVTRTTDKLKVGDTEISVTSTDGFDPAGFFWIGRELVGYAEIDANTFKKLTRGLGTSLDTTGATSKCGPQPAYEHVPGETVIDQRAFAHPLWRLASTDGNLRRFEGVDQLADAASTSLAGKFSSESLALLAKTGSVYAGVRAGHEWQRPVRLSTAVSGGTTCEIGVDETRWFNPGATIKIEDGKTIEFALVEEVESNGVVRLRQALQSDYIAWAAEVSVLNRRPVNINVADVDVLELLFTNLQLRGVNDRIVKSEAKALAELVIESRPFTGEEDFLRRVVLPAAGLERLPNGASAAPAALADGGSIISANDALALYANGQNANDVGLAFSTMPYSYTSRDVYAVQVRSSVNAESGIERVAMIRDEVDVFAPQKELLSLWARQEDFDQALRLDRGAPWWMSGPRATSQYDGLASPPSRLWAHIGTYEGKQFLPGVTPALEGVDASSKPQAEHIFASRDDDGFAQLWPSRVQETKTTSGHMLHFDHETRDPEGRYLPDQPIKLATTDKILGWSEPATNFARPLSFSLWLKPKAITDGLFLDVGRASIESDRVTLGIEGADLVLRVYDAAGDHPATPQLDVGEVRFSVAPGNDPGLMADTWTHVAIDVRGTRPDQMSMQVDGKDFGVRTMGLTRLMSAMMQTSSTFTVESGEGFPAQGVARIGDELVEYVRVGKNAFQTIRTEAGANAGFGGRLAREAFDLKLGGGAEPGVNAALGKQVAHAAGTTVMLYGYSIPLASNVSAASATLPVALGNFAVGVVTKVVGGSNALGDDVFLKQPPLHIGSGMEGATSKVTGLILTSADPLMLPKQVIDAFSPNGGYAVLIQFTPANFTSTQGNSPANFSDKGSPLFGFEIIRYSGVDPATQTLHIQQRNAIKVGKNASLPHAFITDWDPGWTLNGVNVNSYLTTKLFVVPISIPAQGASGSAGFLPPNGASEFAQITHLDQAEMTEWVRYDQIIGNDLVRDDPVALQELTLALTHGFAGSPDNQKPPPGSNNHIVFEPPTHPPIVEPQGGTGGSDWLPYLGTLEDKDYPVTRAARESFQFRGVLGTYAHKHAAGTLVLPVFRVQLSDVHGGRPGRMDAAFLLDADPADPGWPVRLHHTMIPHEYSITPWQTGANLMTPVSSAAVANPEHGFVTQAIYVALQSPAQVPVAGGTVGTNVPVFESRSWSRLVMHPSGERPREVDRVVVGGSIRGGLVPSATIDEVAFGSTHVGEGSTQGNALSGANFLVSRAFSEGDTNFQLAPHAVRNSRGVFGDLAASFLDAAPKDTGLLKIGSEILAYDAVDVGTGEVTVAPDGRGLLGTHPQPHELGETAMLLDSIFVTQLKGAVNATSPTLPIEELTDFPTQGTVLIGDELIHFTHVEGSSLAMPRLSKVAGKKDNGGGPWYRGRFGTTAAAHAAGDPVILFPFRYWDRWTERADGPELAYFGFSLEQPSAFWRSSFFKVQNSASPGTEIGVLQKLDVKVPWDADPENTAGLALLWKGKEEDRPIAIGLESDLAEWRVFVKYSKGAYDATHGLAHGWKTTPRLKMLGASYLAPNQVLRRVDR